MNTTNTTQIAYSTILGAYVLCPAHYDVDAITYADACCDCDIRTLRDGEELAALLSEIKAGRIALDDELPNFGYPPEDTSEVWSCDSHYLLTGTCVDDLSIEPR